MRTDGQMDMTKLTVAFRNFVKESKDSIIVFIKTVSTKGRCLRTQNKMNVVS